MGYTFAAESDVERARLTGLEAMLDPITTDVLTRLGVGPGWRCAEVAAGGGSIVRWLADRVGPTGQVVATDLDIRHLAAVAAPNVEVLRHDLTVDECHRGLRLDRALPSDPRSRVREGARRGPGVHAHGLQLQQRLRMSAAQAGGVAVLRHGSGSTALTGCKKPWSPPIWSPSRKWRLPGQSPKTRCSWP